MGILQKLKSALGMDSSGRTRRRTEPDVTVEHEPSPESERAVKTSVEEEPAASATDEDESEEGSDEGDAAASAAAGTEEASPPVEEITGIGPTYAERLEAAGIETVADLADSDIATVVEAAQATESRAQDWLEQARDN